MLSHPGGRGWDGERPFGGRTPTPLWYYADDKPRKAARVAYIPGPVGLTKCALNWSQNGERCINVVYVDRGAITVSATANFVKDVFGGDMAVGMNNNTSLDFVVATDVGPTLGVVAVSTAAPSVGVATAQALPNDKAIVGTLRTAVGGRSGRGRFYLMGLTIGDITDADPNHITVAARDNYNGFFNDVLAALDSDGLTWGVASYFSGVDGGGHPIPRGTAEFNPVTAISVNRRIDTQRRRLPRT